MSPIHVEASAVIDAPAEQIYAVLADYEVGHPAIVPKRYFQEVSVLEGGRGAGTIIRVRMKVMGVEQTYVETVSEPEPGRMLVEADAAAGVATTFTVEPLDSGRTRVTIATDSRPSPGVRGFFERLLNPAITRRIFQAELQQLGAYVKGR